MLWVKNGRNRTRGYDIKLKPRAMFSKEILQTDKGSCFFGCIFHRESSVARFIAVKCFLTFLGCCDDGFEIQVHIGPSPQKRKFHGFRYTRERAS